MNELKKRNYTLDIIRIFSLFCVASIHFFLNSGFYKQTVDNNVMIVMCIIRSIFIIAVPMFITLTGFLMNRKEISFKYYKGIVRTIIVYILCSIVYFVFCKLYLNMDIGIKTLVKNIISFKGTQYSWYIEMYIGLFCVIPFLNILFNNLKDQKQATIFILILFVLIGLPPIINAFRITPLEWWKNPSSSSNYLKIMPSWWKDVYPLFYYFLGAYISKYKIKLNAKTNIILLIGIIIVDGIFNFYRSKNVEFIWGTWNDYSSAVVMIITFLTFNILLKIRVNENNKIINKCLKWLSDACLGAYLISCIFDSIYYKILNNNITEIKARFVYAPVVVLCVFVSSLFLSLLINVVYFVFNKLIIEKIHVNEKIVQVK